MLIPLLTLLPLLPLATSQLSGPVGPLTSASHKAALKTCNVLSYGGKADASTDLGPALQSAFEACKAGGLIVVPEGQYVMKTWVAFEGGKGWALQLDGVVSRVGGGGGNLFAIRGAEDVEVFSKSGKGVVQGKFVFFWSYTCMKMHVCICV